MGSGDDAWVVLNGTDVFRADFAEGSLTSWARSLCRPSASSRTTRFLHYLSAPGGEVGAAGLTDGATLWRRTVGCGYGASAAWTKGVSLESRLCMSMPFCQSTMPRPDSVRMATQV